MVEWVDQRCVGQRTDYRYQLSESHAGDPVEVWMLGVAREDDEDGRHMIFDRIVGLDGSPVDPEIADAYDDELKEDLVQLAREHGW